MMHMRIYDEDVQKGKDFFKQVWENCSNFTRKRKRNTFLIHLHDIFFQQVSICAVTTTVTAHSCVCPPL